MRLDGPRPVSRHRCEGEGRGWDDSRCPVVEASHGPPTLRKGLVLLKEGS